MNKVRQFLQNEKGQDFIEYALLAGFVATAVASLSPAIAAVVTYMGQTMGLLDTALRVTAS